MGTSCSQGISLNILVWWLKVTIVTMVDKGAIFDMMIP